MPTPLQSAMLESLLLACSAPPTVTEAICTLKFAGYSAAEINANLDAVLAMARAPLAEAA